MTTTLLAAPAAIGRAAVPEHEMAERSAGNPYQAWLDHIDAGGRSALDDHAPRNVHLENVLQAAAWRNAFAARARPPAMV
jgi:hypothetical protein